MTVRLVRRAAAPRPSRAPVTVAAALLAVLALAGCDSAGGPVLHVRITVPMAEAAAPGSACGAADLRATGPVAATVPGSTMTVYDMAGARDVAANDAGVPDAGTLATIGTATVPATGTAIEATSSDAAFPSACRFTFDLPTSRITDSYGFRIGDVYLPVPIATRAALEAGGWVVDVVVNPQ